MSPSAILFAGFPGLAGVIASGFVQDGKRNTGEGMMFTQSESGSSLFHFH
jgi:hypothetical protein